jgi:CheY-like chemotaxis protein
MDGFALIGAIRSRPALDAVPVIFLTMYDDMGTYSRITRLGANDFVNKPVNRAVLLAAIDRCLAAARGAPPQG